MSKQTKLSRIISTIILGIILVIGGVISCKHSHTIEGQGEGDTVAASEFEPKGAEKKLSINLNSITSVRFPKYKLSKATPIIPDSISMAADEETVSSGNYAATLILDTIPNKDFYDRVDAAAQHDTCWSINKFAYTYLHRDKQGGMYKIVFSKGGTQIFVTHVNRELAKIATTPGKEKGKKDKKAKR